jgi:putative sigma-54 modulation protein
MRLELTGRHLEITPALRRLVDRKLQRLERMLNDSALSAQVVLTREKRSRRADVTLHARGEKFLHGVGASAAWEASMTQAIDKIVQQAQKVKGKWQERKRRAPKGTAGPPIIGETPEAVAVKLAAPPPGSSQVRQPARPRMPRILRASKQAVRAMSIGDAARAVDANGDGVVVFRDAETAALSVLIRGADGELTLVETEP